MASHFVKATLELLSDKRLSDGDRIVYLALMSFADFDTLKNCRPSAQGIADRCARSRAAVVRSLTSLVATGWVTRQHQSNDKGQAPSLYAFPRQRGSQMSRTLGSQMSHDQEPVTPARRQRFTRYAASQAIHHLALAQHAANMPSDDIEF